MSQAGGFATEQSGGHRPLISRAASLFSMLASLMLHAVLFVLLLLLFTGGGGSGGDGAAGSGGGDFLEVGFSTRSGGGSDSESPNAEADIDGSLPATASLPTFKSLPTPVVDSQPPISRTLGKKKTPIPSANSVPQQAQTGAPNFASVPKSVGRMRASRGSGDGLGDGHGSGVGDGDGTGGGAGAGEGTGTGSGIGSGAGPGATQFFKIRDRGLKFVYVLDRSVSMSTYNAIRVAKSQLLKSINTLNPEQQFQIIFYNDKPTVLRLGDEDGKSLLRATDINRTVAAQFISSIQPDASTAHLPALEMALSFRPDVVFLLTDAGEPHLTRSEIERVRRLNGGQARIHCIEFHQGRRLTKEVNFLERLAMENGGQYEFRDITEFRAAALR